MTELQSMIAGTVKANPDIKQRVSALKAIQWRFRGPNGEFVGLDSSLRCAFVPEAKSLKFDGRDNQTFKAAMYERTLGALAVEVLC